MTGPEHYKAAEQLLRSADIAIGQFEEQGWDHKRLIADTLTAQAQAHATLAHAAATALSTWNETGMPQPDRKDWWLAASGEPAERRRIKEAEAAEAAEAAEFEEAQS